MAVVVTFFKNLLLEACSGIPYTSLIVIHRSGGEQWWISAELRSGEVNIHHSSPTLYTKPVESQHQKRKKRKLTCEIQRNAGR